MIQGFCLDDFAISTFRKDFWIELEAKQLQCFPALSACRGDQLSKSLLVRRFRSFDAAQYLTIPSLNDFQ